MISIFLVGRKVIRPFADIQRALEKLTWGEVEIELSGKGRTDQLAKLFRAFSQANGSTTRQFGGTGLGLSISQRLVQLMGGLILVDSAREQGSTFQFEIEFALSGQPERVPVVPAALNGARLLLVDDSPTRWRRCCRHRKVRWRKRCPRWIAISTRRPSSRKWRSRKCLALQ